MQEINDVFNYLFRQEKFVSENNSGNIEYKLRIDTKNELSIQKLKTQLIWRLSEGFEESGIEQVYYIIGVYDNGNLGKLTLDELNANVNMFKNIVNEINCIISSDVIKNINDSHVYIAHIMKKKSIVNNSFFD